MLGIHVRVGFDPQFGLDKASVHASLAAVPLFCCPAIFCCVFPLITHLLRYKSTTDACVLHVRPNAMRKSWRAYVHGYLPTMDICVHTWTPKYTNLNMGFRTETWAWIGPQTFGLPKPSYLRPERFFVKIDDFVKNLREMLFRVCHLLYKSSKPLNSSKNRACTI